MPLNLPRTITPHTNVYAYINEITTIIPGLYLSSLMAARNTESLKNRQITHILTILDFPVDFEGWSGTRLVIRLSDGLKSDLLSRFDECVDFIESAIRGGGNVLVHCMQGLSRSVSVVAAYLIRCCGMPVSEALGLIKEKRGLIQPNEGFERQLGEYSRKKRSQHSKVTGRSWLALVMSRFTRRAKRRLNKPRHNVTT